MRVGARQRLEAQLQPARWRVATLEFQAALQQPAGVAAGQRSSAGSAHALGEGERHGDALLAALTLQDQRSPQRQPGVVRDADQAQRADLLRRLAQETLRRLGGGGDLQLVDEAPRDLDVTAQLQDPVEASKSRLSLGVIGGKREVRRELDRVFVSRIGALRGEDLSGTPTGVAVAPR